MPVEELNRVNTSGLEQGGAIASGASAVGFAAPTLPKTLQTTGNWFKDRWNDLFRKKPTASQPFTSPSAVKNGAVITMEDTAVASKGASFLSGAGSTIGKIGGTSLKILGKIAAPLAVVATGFDAAVSMKKKNGHEAANKLGGGIGGLLGFMSAGAVIGAIAGMGVLSIPEGIAGAAIGLGVGVIGAIAGGWIGSKGTDKIIGGKLEQHLHRNDPKSVPVPVHARSQNVEYDNDVPTNHAAKILDEKQRLQQAAAER